MNSNTDENRVKYVVTLSQPNKKVCLRKVNAKDLPLSLSSKYIKCKEISALKLGQQNRTKSDEVELTVVTTSENGASSSDTLHLTDTSVECPAKKIKTESMKEYDDNEDVPSDVIVQPDIEDNEEEDFDEDDIYDDEEYTASEQIKNHPRMSSKQDDYDYVPQGSYKAKRTAMEADRRKVKPKLFRSEWLNIDIFRDWLDSDPTNPYKARCIACDSVMNAGKSELEKHAAGMKHAQALEKMQQEMLMSHLEETNEDTQQTDGSQEHISQPVMFGEELQTELYHIRVQQVDALNRVATAVETLSATAVSVLEKMAATQENLVQIIQELQKK